MLSGSQQRCCNATITALTLHCLLVVILAVVSFAALYSIMFTPDTVAYCAVTAAAMPLLMCMLLHCCHCWCVAILGMRMVLGINTSNQLKVVLLGSSSSMLWSTSFSSYTSSLSSTKAMNLLQATTPPWSLAIKQKYSQRHLFITLIQGPPSVLMSSVFNCLLMMDDKDATMKFPCDHFWLSIDPLISITNHDYLD